MMHSTYKVGDVSEYKASQKYPQQRMGHGRLGSLVVREQYVHPMSSLNASTLCPPWMSFLWQQKHGAEGESKLDGLNKVVVYVELESMQCYASLIQTWSEEWTRGKASVVWLICQSTWTHVLHLSASNKEAKEWKKWLDQKHLLQECILVPNQHVEETYAVPLKVWLGRQLGKETRIEVTQRSVHRTLAWIQKLLVPHNVEIVVLSLPPMGCVNESEQYPGLPSDIAKNMTMKEFIAAHVDDVHLVERLQQSRENLEMAWLQKVQLQTTHPHQATGDMKYATYWSQERLRNECNQGNCFVGLLEVSNKNPSEGYVLLSNVHVRDVDGMKVDKIFVPGRLFMNRSVNGDKVAVVLFPKDEWITPPSLSRLIPLTLDVDASNEPEPLYETKTIQNDAIASTTANSRVPTGKIVGLLQRTSHRFIATIPSDLPSHDVSDAVQLAIPMDARVPKIRIRSKVGSLILNRRLVVQLDDWPVHSFYPNGHYVCDLGPAGELETDITALLTEHDMNNARPFSEAALACLPPEVLDTLMGSHPIEACTAKRSHLTLPSVSKLLLAPLDVDELKDRRDLRSTHRVFSVDPIGCQDIDDAMSVQILPNGHVQVGVHIADVTHYVREGSALDLDARSRSTTVYLVDRRFDMLPPQLSSDLCSLHGNVDRFAMSVLWELTPWPTLDILHDKTWFGKTLIHSVAAMTYEQGHRLLNGLNANCPLENSNVPMGVAGQEVPLTLQQPLRDDLKILTLLGRKLHASRIQAGAVDLSGEQEVKIYAEKGASSNVVLKDHLEIHDTIAELMILANTCVAKRIHEAFPADAFLRRHLPPTSDRFDRLKQCLDVEGIEMDTSSSASVQRSLRKIEHETDMGKHLMPLILSLCTRAMSEAEYLRSGAARSGRSYEGHAITTTTISTSASSDSNTNSITSAGSDSISLEGLFRHYGLGLELYTHFTSPIRRYADIVVHRQLIQALNASATTNKTVIAATAATERGTDRISSVLEIPESKVKSILDDGTNEKKETKEFRNDLLDLTNATETCRISGSERSEVKQKHYKWDTSLESTKDLDAIASMINEKHRMAKKVSKECNDLFLAYYFKDRKEVMDGIIFEVRDNGFLVYVPKIQLKGPVYVTNVRDEVQVNPSLVGVPWADTQEATDGFQVCSMIRLIPSATVHHEKDKCTLHIEVKGKKKISFHLMDRVRVQVSCDFKFSSVRRPPLRFHLITKEEAMTHSREKQKEVFDLVLKVKQRETKEHENDVKPKMVEVVADKRSNTLYDVLCGLGTQQPMDTKTMQAKPRRRPVKAAEQTKISTIRKGKGRIIFNDFPSHLITKPFASRYAKDRSASLEQEMEIHRSSSSTCQNVGEVTSARQLEHDAQKRAYKLSAEKRHARINRRTKAD